MHFMISLDVYSAGFALQARSTSMLLNILHLLCTVLLFSRSISTVSPEMSTSSTSAEQIMRIFHKINQFNVGADNMTNI